MRRSLNENRFDSSRNGQVENWKQELKKLGVRQMCIYIYIYIYIERERERERERDKQRERERERERKSKIERQRDRDGLKEWFSK